MIDNQITEISYNEKEFLNATQNLSNYEELKQVFSQNMDFLQKQRNNEIDVLTSTNIQMVSNYGAKQLWNMVDDLVLEISEITDDIKGLKQLYADAKAFLKDSTITKNPESLRIFEEIIDKMASNIPNLEGILKDKRAMFIQLLEKLGVKEILTNKIKAKPTIGTPTIINGDLVNNKNVGEKGEYKKRDLDG